MPRLWIASTILLSWISVDPSIASPEDDSIVFGQSSPIVDLGPAYAAFQSYPAGYEASFAIYDRLVTFDASLAIRPQLAERWQTSPDNRSLTLFLREGVRFHDGTSMNADAVHFNITRMMDADVNTTNRPLWDPISGVTVLDEHTVEIHCERPFPLLLNTLAHASGAIVSPSAIRGSGPRSMASRPVGAGPFRLERFSPGHALELAAFDGYWQGVPAVEKLHFRFIPDASTRIAALRSGAVDIIDAVPVHMVSSLSRDPRFRVLSCSGLRPMGLAMLTRGLLRDGAVRRALNHAIPVDVIAERVFMGFARAADSPLAFNTAGYRSAGSYPYSASRAKELLAAAGLRDSDGDGIVEKRGEPFRLRMLASDGVFPKDLLVAQIAAYSLKEIGVDVAITKVEQGIYWDALRRPLREVEWDLAIFGFNPSNASGLYHLSSMFRSNRDDLARPEVWNITRYRNGLVDELLDRASVTAAEAERNELLGKAQSLIWKETPYIWLYVDDVVSVSRKELDEAEVWPVSFTMIRDGHY